MVRFKSDFLNWVKLRCSSTRTKDQTWKIGISKIQPLNFFPKTGDIYLITTTDGIILVATRFPSTKPYIFKWMQDSQTASNYIQAFLNYQSLYPRYRSPLPFSKPNLRLSARSSLGVLITINQFFFEKSIYISYYNQWMHRFNINQIFEICKQFNLLKK